jgi:hypothetical protein
MIEEQDDKISPYNSSDETNSSTSLDRKSVIIPRIEFAITTLGSAGIGLFGVGLQWVVFVLRVTIPDQRIEYYQFNSVMGTASYGVSPGSLSIGGADIEKLKYSMLKLKKRHTVSEFDGAGLFIEQGPSIGGKSNVSMAWWKVVLNPRIPTNAETIEFPVADTSAAAIDATLVGFAFGALENRGLLKSKQIAPVVYPGTTRTPPRPTESFSGLAPDEDTHQFMAPYEENRRELVRSKQETYVGVVRNVTGTVTVSRKERATQSAVRGVYLYPGSEISTSDNGTLEFVIVLSHYRIAIGPNAKFVVHSELVSE